MSSTMLGRIALLLAVCCALPQSLVKHLAIADYVFLVGTCQPQLSCQTGCAQGSQPDTTCSATGKRCIYFGQGDYNEDQFDACVLSDPTSHTETCNAHASTPVPGCQNVKTWICGCMTLENGHYTCDFIGYLDACDDMSDGTISNTTSSTQCPAE